MPTWRFLGNCSCAIIVVCALQGDVYGMAQFFVWGVIAAAFEKNDAPS